MHLGLLLLIPSAFLLRITRAQPGCQTIYVRWSRVRMNVTARVSGPYSLKTCRTACTRNEHPARAGYPLQCAGFNHRRGPSSLMHDCQIFQDNHISDFDGKAEADDRFSFFWKYCVNTRKVCNSPYHFTYFADRYMDRIEVAREFQTATLEDCLAECMEENSFTCRSASYNRTGGRCFLSAQNQLSKPGYIRVNNNPNYRIDYYESNCFNNTFTFRHKCMEKGMEISVDSKYPYTGVLYGLYDYFTCRTEPAGETSFTHFFPFPGISRSCADSIRYKDNQALLEVVLSTDGVEPLYFITPEDLTYQARCPVTKKKPEKPTKNKIPSKVKASVNFFKRTDSDPKQNSVNNSAKDENIRVQKKGITLLPKKDVYQLPLINPKTPPNDKGSKISVIVKIPTKSSKQTLSPASFAAATTPSSTSLTSSPSTVPRTVTTPSKPSTQTSSAAPTSTITSTTPTTLISIISTALKTRASSAEPPTRKVSNAATSRHSVSASTTTEPWTTVSSTIGSTSRTAERSTDAVKETSTIGQTTVTVQTEVDSIASRLASSGTRVQSTTTSPATTVSTTQETTTNRNPIITKATPPPAELSSSSDQPSTTLSDPTTERSKETSTSMEPMNETFEQTTPRSSTQPPDQAITGFLEESETNKLLAIDAPGKQEKKEDIVIPIEDTNKKAGIFVFGSKHSSTLTPMLSTPASPTGGVVTSSTTSLTPTFRTTTVTPPIPSTSQAQISSKEPKVTPVITRETLDVSSAITTKTVLRIRPSSQSQGEATASSTSRTQRPATVSRGRGSTDSSPSSASAGSSVPSTTETNSPTKASTSTATTTTETTTTTSTPSTGPPEKPILFDVFHRGQPVKAVVAGSRVSLSLTPYYPIPPSYMSLVGCQVEPVKSLFEHERFPLPIVRDGCQADNVGLVCPPEKTDFGYKILMESFPYQSTAQVQYTCLVRICPFSPCPQNQCSPVDGCPSHQLPVFNRYRPANLRRNKRQLFTRAGPTVPNPGQTNPFFTASQPPNRTPTVVQQYLIALAGDHLVSKKLVIFNEESHLQYYISTGRMPPTKRFSSGIPGFSGFGK